MITPDAKPKLPRGVRLTHNEAQGGWVLLAPERVFKAEGPASSQEIADVFAEFFLRGLQRAKA